jgi:hypothetical protein
MSWWCVTKRDNTIRDQHLEDADGQTFLADPWFAGNTGQLYSLIAPLIRAVFLPRIAASRCSPNVDHVSENITCSSRYASLDNDLKK